jgi:plastocyanin
VSAANPCLRRAVPGVLLLVVALLLGASFAPAFPALAQEQRRAPVQVTLTADGPQPEFIEVPVGASVVFVNDDTVQHQVTATLDPGKSTAWEYDSGVIGPKNGEDRPSSPPTPVFERAGRYTFNDTRGLVLTQTFPDEIGVLAPPPPRPTPSDDAGPSEGGAPAPGSSSGPSSQQGGSSTPPSGSAPAANSAPAAAPPPAPAAPGPAPVAPEAPGPAPTGGTGTTRPLPLDGGFGSFGSSPTPIPGLDPLAPAIAPPLELAAEAPAPLPEVAAATPTRAPGVAALPIGSLPGSPTGREYGLPAVLAAVSIVGVVSLLVRVLLAEPVTASGAEGGLGSRPVPVPA